MPKIIPILLPSENHAEKNIEVAKVAPGDLVVFTNPQELKWASRFEGIELVVEQIVADLAFCRLPDGKVETFGTYTLEICDF